MTVIDAPALAKYLLRERGWRGLEPLLERGAYTLDLAVKEVANAVWKHSALRGVVEPGLALSLYRALRGLVEAGVVIVEREDEYVDGAVEIAFQARATVYDALYIAQARRRGPLVTADSRQAEAARGLGVEARLV